MYKEFWELFAKGYGGLRMASLIMVITIGVSLLEGFNMGLLLPLLESLESPEQGGGHWVSNAFARLFGVLGLQMELKTILVVLAVLVLVVAALKYLRTILATKTDVGFLVWMKSKVMGNFLHSDLSYFHRQELGKLTNTLVTQVDHAGGTFFSIAELVTSVSITCAYLTAALLISPVLTAVSLGTMLIVTLAMQYFIAKARTMGTLIVSAHSELQAEAVETLSGIRVVKSFLLERVRWARFTSKAEAFGRLNYKVDVNRGQAVIVQEIALFALIGGIVFVAISVMGLDLAVTVALLFVLYRMAPRINTLNNIRQGLAVSMASLHQVKVTIDETASPKIISGDQPFSTLKNGIELKNVSFSYNGGPTVLRDANFVMEKGKMTALVGTSGAGKSTVMDLILRYHDPVQGAVLVDGSDLRDLDLVTWRQAIGVVSQDVFLFNDTIANNIGFGQPGTSMERIVEAAKRAYAHGFIEQLSEGYDTVVGDRGWNLSGGERQRVALARAILRQPEILILDEATSSLDSESESLIQQYIREIRDTCTIVVVAHRMSTIQDADKIAVLENGRIVEEGDWDSLLAEAGVFANYHRLQFRS